MNESAAQPKKAALVTNARKRLLEHITGMTDKVMVGLALIWVGLMIGDFIGGLPQPLELLENVIWGIFGLDFLVKFFVAPRKLAFLRSHWLTLISLVLPAFRLLRIVQAVGALRAVSLLRILTSVNTNMTALSKAMGRRGIGYVTVVTLIVLFVGAGGMYYFERPSQLIADGFGKVAAQGGGLHSYSDAVWWTAMLMTTIGSQYWPVTLAGRALCFILSLFSLGVFGYITAALAGFFVDKDARGKKKRSSEQDALLALTQEVAALRTALEARGVTIGQDRDPAQS